MVTAAVIGARGYLGRETIRLLCDHPAVETVLPVSRSAAGTAFAEHVRSHRGKLLVHDEEASRDADILFLATPPGEAPRFAAQAEEQGSAVIDLSRDHRQQALRGDDGWHYGLADLQPPAKGHRRVANPGCYPTGALLGLLPAHKHAAPGPVIVDGKSGVSGAGVGHRPEFHYPHMNESVRAYKVAGHDHTEEIAHGLDLGGNTRVRFTPHLVPQTRGLLATGYMPLRDGVSQEDMQETYYAAYSDSPFVHVVEEPDTAHVRGSNHADVAVHVDEDAGLLVTRCAIDNLLKGGAGTAVQNMNHILGLDATTGLTATGGSP